MEFKDLCKKIDDSYDPGGMGLADSIGDNGDFNEEKLVDIGDTLLVFVGREVRDMLEERNNDGVPIPTLEGVRSATEAMHKAIGDLYKVIDALEEVEEDLEKQRPARERLSEKLDEQKNSGEQP